MHNSFVLCNSVSADRSGMLASRFLAAAVASVLRVLHLRVVNRIVTAA